VEVCTIVVIVELVMKGVVDVRVVSVVTPVKNVLTKNDLNTLDFIGGFFMRTTGLGRACWWDNVWLEDHPTPSQTLLTVPGAQIHI
jgi:hypothetical protein